MSYVLHKDPKLQTQRWTSMVREIVILELVVSPNVIKVIEFIRTKNNFYLVEEFANGGTL